MPPVAPSSNPEAEVLLANESFYRAFSQGDLRSMSKLWAHLTTVTCFHPGMQALVGREAVMRSWSRLLRRRPEVPLRCLDPRVQLLGDTAIVTCYEGADQNPAHLAATNVYVRENLEWKMVHHHAGPIEHPVTPRKPSSGWN